MRPSFTVVAGANGCGKSSLTAAISSSLLPVPLLDPDAVAKAIRPSAFEGAALEAGRQVLRAVDGHLKASRSFAVETTLSGKTYLQKMTEAKLRGFQVELIYIGTESVEINLQRIAGRVLLGGHNVPEADVRRRYRRSLDHLHAAIELADTGWIFDNSNARKYQLIGVIEQSVLRWKYPLPDWVRVIADPAQ